MKKTRKTRMHILRLAGILLCIALLLPLTSCRKAEDVDNTTLLLFSDTVSCLILNGFDSAEAKATVKAFTENVKIKTGYSFGYSSSGAGEEVPEIIIGVVSKRQESTAIYGSLRWSGRDIRVSGNQIYVNTRSEIYLEEMLSALLRAITKTDAGWVIATDYVYSQNAGRLDEDLPMLETKGTDLGVVPSDDGNRYVATYQGVTEAEHAAYLEKLNAAGFATYDENEINANRFGTYTNGKTQVNLCWYPSKTILRICYGASGDLPELTEQETEKTVQPSIAQPMRWAVDESSPNGAPGMGYVIQLSDGRYILVDGGQVDRNGIDPRALLNYLIEHKPASHEKPIIVAWIITHAHEDHITLPIRFLRDFHSEVTLEMSVTNFPFKGVTMKSDNTAKLASFASTYRSLVEEHYPKAKKIVIHTGQRLRIGDAYLEFLHTHEDRYPNTLNSANETSLVFRVTLGGRTALFLGDLDACAFLRDVYGTAVKSDILQLTHHGFNGGDLSLYRNVDPEICLWATDRARFETDERCLGTKSGFEFNKWIRNDSIRVRTHCHNSVTTIVHLNGDETTVETIG